jgi:hypothetical protein
MTSPQKAAELTVDQIRSFVLSAAGVFLLFAALKSPVNPTGVTTACSLLGLEPAIRARPQDPPGDKPKPPGA